MKRESEIESHPGALESTSAFATLREQESVLILLNLGIISSLVLIQIVFQPTIGAPSLPILGAFIGRFVWQAIELAWLHSLPETVSARGAAVYAVATVWIHVAFGAMVPFLSPLEHSHYVVLMLLPTIAAAFRFGWVATIAVALVASLATFAEVRLHFNRLTGDEQVSEYFEAATVVLIFFAVAIVVRLLVAQLRIKETHLCASLDELARARDRLIAEEKLAAIGRLSAAVAHEVRNPVAIIAGTIANGRSDGADDAAREQMFGVIQQQSERLSALTEAFLDYARQKQPERVRTSLRVTLEYVASLARPRADTLGVALVVECDQTLESAFDAFQIHQALLNLALNAVEAAGAGGRATLSGRMDPAGDCVFTVENTGRPIAEASLARLFEPFYTTKPRGTGLGLAIARKIAEAHGGALSLVCNRPDEVIFELRLGAAAAERSE